MAPRAVVQRASALAAARSTLLGRFLAAQKTVRTRSTYLEGLDRIGALFGKPAERVAWHTVRTETIDVVVTRMATTRYSPATMHLAMASLRAMCRHVAREGLMTTEDCEACCEPRKNPWMVRRQLLAMDQEAVAKRYA